MGDTIHGVVVTGFYGTGKTNVIRHLVYELLDQCDTVGVITNSICDISVDMFLLEHEFPEDRVVIGSVVGGSVCAQEEQLKKQVSALIASVDYILIETCGETNPFQVTQYLNELCTIDGIITVMDPFAFGEMNKDIPVANLIKAQASAADIIVMNKTDETSEDTIQKYEASVKSFNSFATIVKTTQGAISASIVCNKGLFQPDRSCNDLGPIIPSMKSFIYCSETAFSPKRLHRVVLQKSIAPLREPIRIKGIVNLASRQERYGLWAKTKNANHTFTGGHPWSERKQQIVVIGYSLQDQSIKHLLDACLLTKPEHEKESGYFQNDDAFGVWGPPPSRPKKAPKVSKAKPQAPPKEHKTTPPVNEPKNSTSGAGKQDSPLGEFVGKVTELCDQVVLSCKSLVTLVVNGEEDEQEQASDESAAVIETAKIVAVKTSALVDGVVKPFVRKPTERDPKLEELLNLARDVRDRVLELIRASKKADANRLDFMTKQKVSNALQNVVNSVNALVSKSDLLAKNEGSSSTSGTASPAVALSPGNGSSSPNQSNVKVLKDEATGHAKAMAMAIRNADRTIKTLPTDAKEFIRATRACIQSSKKLRAFAQGFRLVEEQKQLKAAVAQFVSTGKLLVTQSNERTMAALQEWEKAKRSLAESIKKTLVAIQHCLVERASAIPTGTTGRAEETPSPRKTESPTGSPRNRPPPRPPRQRASNTMRKSLAQDREASGMLEKLIAMKNYHQWRSTLAVRNNKFIRIPSSPEFADGNTQERLQAIQTALGESIVEFVVSANEHSLTELPYSAEPLQRSVESLYSHLKNTVRVAKEVLHKCTKPGLVRKFLDLLITVITNAPIKGTRNERVLEAAKTDKRVDRYQSQQIFNQSKGIITLALQLMAALLTLEIKEGLKKQEKRRKEEQAEATVIFILSVLQSLLESIRLLLDLTETAKEIVIQEKGGADEEEDPEQLLDTLEDDINIWADKGELRMMTEKKENSLNILGGSLNKLVEMLTSDTQYDNRYLKTFITTYQSFTTPAKLFEKLLQRYNTPDNLPSERAQQIKLRVCVVLQYWVGHQFFDFDSELIGNIFDFVENTIKNDGNKQLADMLARAIKTRIEDRKKQLTSMFIKPQELKPPNNVRSIWDMIMDTNNQVLAQQLTLVEFKVYSSIDPSELLSQAWNNKKYKHRAPHVIAIIQRANRFSYWVASMILSQPTPKGRKKMYEKFMGIALELRKMNNFNTLMGIIAGISTSSINRLAIMKNDASKRVSKAYAKLEQLMHPQKAFASYRELLHASSPPLIPYMGVYLSDLTFIDENPDKLPDTTLINFAKQELVYGIIEEVRQYQQTPYKNLKSQEPIYTFLAKLATMPEKTLFELSLDREPRKK